MGANASVLACAGKIIDGADSSADGAVSDANLDSDRCRAAAWDAALGCDYFVTRLYGDLSTCGFDGGGATTDTCDELCGRPQLGHGCSVSGDMLTCPSTCPVVVDGRRPPGPLAAPTPNGHGLGAYFARMAYFEAASVYAFDVLDRELSFHGAPAALLRSIRRARRDEQRHARMATRLAARHGARTTDPIVEAIAIRPLEAIARDNAVEGCARETLGALVGIHQSMHAESRSLRRFYAAIARDECRHAALAWRIQEWLMPRLSRSARARVERAWREALDPNRVGTAGTTATRAQLGLPSDELARSFARDVESSLAA